MTPAARMAIALVTFAAAGGAVAAMRAADRPAMDVAQDARAPAAPPARAITSVDAATIAGLVTRSPFAPDRDAFSRVVATAPPPPPPLNVRLVAVFSVGGEPRAALQINGEDVAVGVGDETAAGTVVAIESEAVEIEGETARRVGLFD